MTITTILIIITALISWRAFHNDQLFYKLAHWPYKEHQNKEYYRFLSSGFVHGNWLHLLINMFVLYIFGEFVETHFILFFGSVTGKVYYVLVYLITIICADIPTYLKKQNNPSYMAVGASGGVSGLVFIFILLYPWQLLYLYGLIPIPGIVAGVLYLWYSSYASKRGKDRIDHDAHFYGALVGVILTVLLKPSLISQFSRKLINEFPL